MECMAPEAAAHVLGLMAACPGMRSPGQGAEGAEPACGPPELLLQLALTFYSISLAVVECPLPLSCWSLWGVVRPTLLANPPTSYHA